MERIQSDEYFDAVKAYFVDHKEPYRVYKFLLDTLREDEYKLSEDIINQSVDVLETKPVACAFASAQSVFLFCAHNLKNKALSEPSSFFVSDIFEKNKFSEQHWSRSINCKK